MRVIRILARALASAAALSPAAPSVAETLYCAGTSNGAYVSDQGEFILRGSWRNDYTMVCHLRQTWKGIAPETCAFWYALMVTSQTNAKPVTVYYTNSAYTCATLPTYQASPAPGYVMQN